MEQKIDKTDDFTKLLLKLEAAEELGLKKKIKEKGWGGLTAEETGKLGGYITKKIKKNSQEEKADK